MPTNANEIRPLEALQALRKLLADPDDTEQAFRIVRALDSIQRLRRKIAAEPEGPGLLHDRPSLLASLANAEMLRSLPDGSLGRAYLAFCEREGITPGGLVEASDAAANVPTDPELRWVAERMRDSHDLWHVVAGYRTDLGGELSVLAFTAGQTRGAGISLLVAGAYFHSFTLPKLSTGDGRRMARAALVHGAQAAFLPAIRWESRLALPLDEVRRELGVRWVPVYEPIYNADVKAAQAAAA